MTVLKEYANMILAAISQAEAIGSQTSLLLSAITRETKQTSEHIIQASRLRGVMRTADAIAEELRQIYDHEVPKKEIANRYFAIGEDGAMEECSEESYVARYGISEEDDMGE